MDFLKEAYKVNGNQTIDKKLTNSVTITASNTTYGNYEATTSADFTVQRQIGEWITKTGTAVNLSTGESTWTVIIRNNGFKLKNVQLHDKITADDATTITVSDVDVVKIPANANPATATGTAVAFTDNASSMTGKELLVSFTDLMEGDAVYKVTYKTKIENIEEYLRTNHSIPKNSAYVTYEYDFSGKGTYTKFIGPSVEKDFGGIVSKAAISKTTAGINVVDHTMSWKVVANQSKQPLTGATVIDTLPAGHKFAKISYIKIGDSSFTPAEGDTPIVVNGNTISWSYDATASPKTVTLNFGDAMKSNTVEFEIVTELDDTQSDVWAANNSRDYTNKVKLNYTGNTGEIFDTATQKYSSTVLEKAAGAYNYADHTIEYTLTINKNGMEMNGVNISDELDSRLQYLKDSVSVSGTNDGFADQTATGSNSLVFHFDKITSQVTLKFKAKVIDGAHFNTNGSFSISNKASLTSAEYSKAPVYSQTVSTTITNKVIDKAATRVSNSTHIDYTVSLNPAKQQLYTGAVETVCIKDTLGASLILDEGSVKLYIGDVEASKGTIQAKTEITPITKSVKTENGKTVLEVTIPKDKNGNAFVLKYSADVADLEAKDITNNVQLLGYGAAEKNNAAKDFEASSFQNVEFNKFTYIVVELQDEDDKHVLKGAQFKLSDAAGNVVADKITASNGRITVVGKLVSGQKYYLKQITKSSSEYVIPSSLVDGTVEITAVGPGLATANKNKTIVYNKKPATNNTPTDPDPAASNGTPADPATTTTPGSTPSGTPGNGSGTTTPTVSEGQTGGATRTPEDNGSGRRTNAQENSIDNPDGILLLTNANDSNKLADPSSEESILPDVLGVAYLEQTGGFVGTVMGYVVGVMFVIAGLLLVFGKRKRV